MGELEDVAVIVVVVVDGVVVVDVAGTAGDENEYEYQLNVKIYSLSSKYTAWIDCLDTPSSFLRRNANVSEYSPNF